MLDLALIAPQGPRRILRSEFAEMCRAGLFEGERVELLDGMIVDMAPTDPPHASPIQWLTELLVPRLLARATVRVQLDYLAHGDSQPLPDVAIVPLGAYRQQHPDRAHCIIEIAWSSLRKDRLFKAPLYARSGVREYWLCHAEERCLLVFRDSDGERYRSETRHEPGEEVALLDFPDVSVPVAGVFG